MSLDLIRPRLRDLQCPGAEEMATEEESCWDNDSKGQFADRVGTIFVNAGLPSAASWDWSENSLE